MYSQHDEENYILNHFKNIQKGKFLDVGAYDGIKISNTYQLHLNGWHGTYLEPSAKTFMKLSNNIKKNCRLVNCALGEKNDIIEFWDCCETNGKFGVSSVVKDHADSWTHGHFAEHRGATTFDFYYTTTITWEKLISKFGTDYNFISIDVESLNGVLLNLFPIEKFKKLSLFCIEKENGIILDKMYKNNFKLYHETPHNYIFQRILNVKFL